LGREEERDDLKSEIKLLIKNVLKLKNNKSPTGKSHIGKKQNNYSNFSIKNQTFLNVSFDSNNMSIADSKSARGASRACNPLGNR